MPRELLLLQSLAAARCRLPWLSGSKKSFAHSMRTHNMTTKWLSVPTRAITPQTAIYRSYDGRESKKHMQLREASAKGRSSPEIPRTSPIQVLIRPTSA